MSTFRSLLLSFTFASSVLAQSRLPTGTIPPTEADVQTCQPVGEQVSEGLGANLFVNPRGNAEWETEPTHRGCQQERGLFESDRAFPNFIGPISNPVLSKDPRSTTEARLLFINNWIPNEHPLGGGDFQVYALQLRLALTERLTFIADKDGIATLSPSAAPSQTGLLNVAAGLRYLFVRDVENQFLLSGGFMWEPQSGYANVFQSHGDGLLSFFATAAKEHPGCFHSIVNVGFQQPIDSSENSRFFYTSLHFDKQVAGWLYPLVELNWFHYTDGGNRGLPPTLGEGDGLLNLGTSGVAGNDLVTVAVGVSAILSDHVQAGLAYETPISNRKDLLDHRLLVELILRY